MLCWTQSTSPALSPSPSSFSRCLSNRRKEGSAHRRVPRSHRQWSLRNAGGEIAEKRCLVTSASGKTRAWLLCEKAAHGACSWALNVPRQHRPVFGKFSCQKLTILNQSRANWDFMESYNFVTFGCTSAKPQQWCCQIPSCCSEGTRMKLDRWWCSLSNSFCRDMGILTLLNEATRLLFFNMGKIFF